MSGGDLCRWLRRLQVAHKYMPLQSLIVGIDIVPIKPIRGVVTITEDITTERCRVAIKKVRTASAFRRLVLVSPSVALVPLLTPCASLFTQTLPTKDALFDIVVCDGAPNVGGAWAREVRSRSFSTGATRKQLPPQPTRLSTHLPASSRSRTPKPRSSLTRASLLRSSSRRRGCSSPR